MKHFSFIALTILTLAFSVIWSAEAQDTTKDYVPLTGIYGITDKPLAGDSTGDARLTRMVQNAFNLLIGIAGLAAVVMISYGALLYMGESVTKKGDGRTIMWNAVVGLLLVLFTYTILFTINPDILKIKIAVQDLGITGDPTSQQAQGGTTYDIENTADARAQCLRQRGTVIEPVNGETQVRCIVPPANASQEEIDAGSDKVIYRGGADGVAWCRGAFNESELNAYSTRCLNGEWKMVPTRTLTTRNPDGTSVSKQFHIGICRQEKIVNLTRSYTDAQLSSWTNWTVWAVINEEAAWQQYESACSGNGKFTPTSLATLKNSGAISDYVSQAKLICEPGVYQNVLADKCLPPDHR